jgi:hypothetical protein
MNFYYDPILGLQYDYLGEIIQFDVESLPEDLNIQHFLEEWRRTYNIYLDAGIRIYPEVEIIGSITNYKL